MIFVGYEPGSKGYQFWDAAHQHFEISHDVKFKETLFSVKEVKSGKLNWASSYDQPISESDNESEHLGLELVIPDQPPIRPPSPGQSALRQTAQKPQKQIHPNPPIAPLLRFNSRGVEIHELRPEVVAEDKGVLVHYRSRTNV